MSLKEILKDSTIKEILLYKNIITTIITVLSEVSCRSSCRNYPDVYVGGVVGGLVRSPVGTACRGKSIYSKSIISKAAILASALTMVIKYYSINFYVFFRVRLNFYYINQ